MAEILSLSFMQNALLAGVLVSIVCGMIGSLVVINRMTFIAGGIAHGAYGGIGLAFFFSLEPLLGAGLFSLFLALVIATITLHDKTKIDSVIGAIWAFGMAIGIIFIDLTPGYNADLMSYLFGSILAVSHSDLLFMGAIDAAFIVIIAVFYRQFVALSFDAEFAKLRGVDTTFFLLSTCVYDGALRGRDYPCGGAYFSHRATYHTALYSSSLCQEARFDDGHLGAFFGGVLRRRADAQLLAEFNQRR